jgi:hypothetical protein
MNPEIPQLPEEDEEEWKDTLEELADEKEEIIYLSPDCLNNSNILSASDSANSGRYSSDFKSLIISSLMVIFF